MPICDGDCYRNVVRSVSRRNLLLQFFSNFCGVLRQLFVYSVLLPCFGRFLVRLATRLIDVFTCSLLPAVLSTFLIMSILPEMPVVSKVLVQRVVDAVGESRDSSRHR